MSEIENTKARIQNYDGIIDSFSTNMTKGGVETTSNQEAEKRGKIMNTAVTLTKKARILIRDLDPQNDLTFLRIKTKTKEMMVSPDKDLIFIVLQNTSKDKIDDN